MHKKALERARHKRVAEELGRGVCIRQAMVAAGYSDGQAKRGTAALPQGVFDEMAKQGQSYTKLGRLFKPGQRADIVRGALVRNVLERQDRAVRSIELLGKDVEVGVFKSDAAAVNVQINLPAGLSDLFPELNAVKPEQLEEPLTMINPTDIPTVQVS
jgi:hypothetical protein